MSYKEHPFYRQMLQSQRNRRGPATHRSNYSTASTAGGKTERFSVDDFFAQGRSNHDELKKARILQEFQENQRLTNQAPIKNTAIIAVPETDVERLKRLNLQQVAQLPEHLQKTALKILNEDTDTRAKTDRVINKCDAARYEIKDDIKYYAKIV